MKLSEFSEHAEGTVRKLNRSFADLAAMRRPLPASTAAGPTCTRSLLYPFALGLAEDFTAERLSAAAGQGAIQSGLASALWERFGREFYRTWDTLFEGLRLLCEIDVGGFESIDELRGHIEARNVLVHGGGGLTTYQRRDRSKTVARLEAAGLALEAGLLVVDDSAVDRLRVAVQGYVLWLDGLTAA